MTIFSAAIDILLEKYASLIALHYWCLDSTKLPIGPQMVTEIVVERLFSSLCIALSCFDNNQQRIAEKTVTVITLKNVITIRGRINFAFTARKMCTYLCLCKQLFQLANFNVCIHMLFDKTTSNLRISCKSSFHISLSCSLRVV